MKRRPGSRSPLTRGRLRSLARKGGAIFLFVLLIWSGLALWFVHHPRHWLEAQLEDSPILCTPLVWLGEPLGNVTDGLGLTGHDIIRTTDRAAPSGEVLFAGAPKRVGGPAPDDIRILDRGDFLVGWSPSLRHPVWCAYHVPAAPSSESGKRPPFKFDPSAPGSPAPKDYARSGYDRGHMVPNYAAATRFGRQTQEKTFLMSNITPQRSALNRGVWRELEHRIAELWTARWGEIWVIVGCLSDGKHTLGDTDIDVPSKMYEIIVAQRGNEVRAMGLMIEQEVESGVWPTRYLVPIDTIESLSGLDFLSDLDDTLEEELESDCPTRLWPVCFTDLFELIRAHKAL